MHINPILLVLTYLFVTVSQPGKSKGIFLDMSEATIRKSRQGILTTYLVPKLNLNIV